MEIQWHVERLDENEEVPPSEIECLFEAEGIVRCDGEDAGEVGVTYVYAEDPASDEAFLWIWDLTAAACSIYEDIKLPRRGVFRDPLPKLLGYATGVLCVHYIALKPAFRGHGLGREVMRETVHQFADARVGAVLLDVTPLQHRPGGYDDFLDEARELPFNEPEVDHARLVRHFEDWGMRPIHGSRFAAAAPGVLCDGVNPDWFPGLLH